jgi:flagellar hook-basal body complex protein FliE
MDGLTVRNANRLLETGKTSSELRSHDFGPSGGKEVGKSFADTLKESMNEVNRLQQVADVKTQQLATGKTDNIPDVMIAVEKADIAMKLMVQVRNKIINAYNEIMKMQV